MARFWLVMLAFISTSALAQPEAVPRELAQRLSGLNTMIWVGKLPHTERLGFKLAVPPETQVVGANASDETDESYNFVTVYLTSAQTTAGLKAFYQKTLQPSDWKRGQGYNQQPGFLPAESDEPVDTLTFCRTYGEVNTDIYFTFTPRNRKTLADIQVITYSNTQSGSPCEGDNTYTEPPLPSLVAPETSTSSIAEYLSGFGQGNGSSIIVLETDLEAEALLRHYARQLKENSWREQGVREGQPGQVAVYRFHHQGGAFMGTLQITPLAKKRYLAQLTVVKPRP